MSGGTPGIRDQGLLESAIAQPFMSFGDQEMYPMPAEKAAAFAFSLAKNHPFVDGNKRVAHGAMVLFLTLSGYRIEAGIDEQERLFLQLAAGNVGREELSSWIEEHSVPV